MTLAVKQSGYALEYVKKSYQRKLICVAYCVAGRAILGHRWFQTLFQTLTTKQQKSCIQQEIDDKNSAANKWWSEFSSR